MDPRTRAAGGPARRDVLKAALAAPLVASACSSERGGPARREGRPDVLVLVSDDQGRELGAYGRRSVRTPNLDRLAREGCRFDRAYTPVSVCTPSRAVLYTGLPPARNGCDGFNPIGEGVPVWGDLLGPAGYRTGLIGKLGGAPVERFRFDFFDRTLPESEGARSVEWHVDALDAFLRADDGRPSCCLVNFRDAHFPFPTDGAPTGWPGAREEPHDPAAVDVPPFLVDAPAVRVELARFHDALRRLDVTVGAMLGLLAERGRAESTLVLFTSDNGIPFPFAKTTLYEAGVHMPLVARWPGVVEEGRTSEALVDFADVLPTLLDVAGADVPASLDGRSLLPLLTGATDVHREAVFGSHTEHREQPAVPSRSVRAGDWKYIKNFRTGSRFVNMVMRTSATWPAMLAAAEHDPALAERVHRLQYRPREELYDLAADPHELVELAAGGEHAAVVAELRERVRAEMARVEDPLLDEWG